MRFSHTTLLLVVLNVLQLALAKPTRVWKLKQVSGKMPCGLQPQKGQGRKMPCGQPRLEPGSRVVQFEASVRVRSTFLTDFFLFLCRKFTFGGPETGSEKKKFQNGIIIKRTDLSSIWRLPGPTLRTRKRLCSRETAQMGDPDRTL